MKQFPIRRLALVLALCGALAPLATPAAGKTPPAGFCQQHPNAPACRQGGTSPQCTHWKNQLSTDTTGLGNARNKLARAKTRLRNAHTRRAKRRARRAKRRAKARIRSLNNQITLDNQRIGQYCS